MNRARALTRPEQKRDSRNRSPSRLYVTGLIHRHQHTNMKETNSLPTNFYAANVEVGKFRQPTRLNSLQMVQFECPRHSNPCASLRLGEFHIPIFSLPLSPVQLECPRHSLRLGEFHFPSLGCVSLRCGLPLSRVKRIGLPSIKMWKLENLGNKIGLTGCKWSSLNAPGTQTPLYHPFLELGEFPFSVCLSLG